MAKAKAIKEVDNGTWFLSGVGDVDGAIGFEGLIPLPGYDARWKSLQEDENSMSPTVIHAKAYKNQYVSEILTPYSSFEPEDSCTNYSQVALMEKLSTQCIQLAGVFSYKNTRVFRTIIPRTLILRS